jgi:hypothetical protein
MGGAEIPNATSLIALAFAAISAALISFFERRKRKKDPDEQPTGETQVVAASFVERRQMEDLIAVMKALDSTTRNLTTHIEKINERMHEDEIVRAAVAKIKEGRP